MNPIPGQVTPGGMGGRRLTQTSLGNEPKGCNALVISYFSNNGNPYDANGNLASESFVSTWTDTGERYWSTLPNDLFSFVLQDMVGCTDNCVDSHKCFCSYGGLRMSGVWSIYNDATNNNLLISHKTQLTYEPNIFMSHYPGGKTPREPVGSSAEGRLCSTSGSQFLDQWFNGQRSTVGRPGTLPFQSWRFQYVPNTMNMVFIFYAQLDSTSTVATQWFCLMAPSTVPGGTGSGAGKSTDPIWRPYFAVSDQTMTGCTQWRMCDFSECNQPTERQTAVLPPYQFNIVCLLNTAACDGKTSGRLEVPISTQTSAFCKQDPYKQNG
jgi:hypothetical protein